MRRKNSPVFGRIKLKYVLVVILWILCNLFFKANKEVSVSILGVLVFICLIIIGLRRGKPFLRWCGIVFIVTLMLEIISIHTSFPFGSYTYSSLLGMQIGRVPLLIGLLWIFVILGAYMSVQTLRIAKSWQPFVGAVLLVVFDFFLEPAAISLGFWNWSADVPFQNYASWFVISIVSIYGLRKIKLESVLATILFLGQIIIFAFTF